MQNNQQQLALLALVAAVALLGVVVVTVAFTIPTQEAEARGCMNPNAPAGGSITANASKGRCAR